MKEYPTISPSVSTSFVPEGSRSQQAEALGDAVPTITLEQIRKFNRESEKALLGATFLPSSGPEPLFYQYANTHRLQRVLLLEVLDFLHEVGCPHPQAKTYGADPFIQIHLWGVVKKYWHPEITIEEVYYLFTFEWEKVKSAFYDEDQKVPQTFLQSYRKAAERVIFSFSPEMTRAAYVAGGCGGPGDSLTPFQLGEGERDAAAERAEAFVQGHPFKWEFAP